MKTHLKNLNLNRIRNFDKEEVRQTKHLLKKLLSDNLGKSSVLKGLSEKRSLAKEDLKGAMQNLGHPLNENQLDIMMYYINPYHAGKISKDNINKAAGNLQRFDDNVTTDMRDGVSVASSQLGSVASFKSTASIKNQIDRVKDQLIQKSTKGVIFEPEFRDIISKEFPLLTPNQLDEIVQDSAKVPNNPDKIYHAVLPKHLIYKVGFSQ